MKMTKTSIQSTYLFIWNVSTEHSVCFWANNAMKLFIYARHKYIKDVILNDNVEIWIEKQQQQQMLWNRCFQLILLFSDVHGMRMVGQSHWKMSNAVGRN